MSNIEDLSGADQALLQAQSEAAAWRELAQQRADQLHQLQCELDLRKAHQINDVWYYQGDGDDHIRSLGNRQVVVIYGSDLRALIRGDVSAKERQTMSRQQTQDVANRWMIANKVADLVSSDQIKALVNQAFCDGRKHGLSSVAWPQSPKDIRSFIDTNFVSAQYFDSPSDVDVAQLDRAHDNDRYVVSAHDLLSSFEQWSGSNQSPDWDLAEPLINLGLSFFEHKDAPTVRYLVEQKSRIAKTSEGEPVWEFVDLFMTMDACRTYMDERSRELREPRCRVVECSKNWEYLSVRSALIEFVQWVYSGPRSRNLTERFEIRQLIGDVHSRWLKTVFSSQFERVAEAEFGRLKGEHDDQYFELIKLVSGETCMQYVDRRGAGE